MEPSAQETGLTEHVKAGFWIRWAALLIDNLILSIGGGVLGGCCGFFVGFFGALAKAGQRETQLLAAVLGGLLGAFLQAAYFTILTWRYGQTLGKKVLNLKVVTTEYDSLTFGKAFLREVIGKFISTAILLIGFLWAAWDEKKQALHDKLAGTCVVKTK
jgi:uncharacterized RDD family membrane protein YckC